MSLYNNIIDSLDEHDGSINTFSQLRAINQRGQQIHLAHDQIEALRQQTSELQKQNLIEQDRASIEQQRLDIERQRMASDVAERELRIQQANQIKELRNLITEATFSINRFQKRHLV